MTRMIRNPRLLLDQRRDPRKRPERSLEAVRLGTLQQGLHHLLELFLAEARLLAGMSCLQTLFSLLLPGLIPVADTHAADMQATSDLAIGEIGFQELSGLHPALFFALSP